MLTAGDRLGVYEIVAHVGSGGMGDVYRARDPRVGRDVAIKVSAERFSQQVEREARAIAALNHPNICALYDVGPNYLVLEFVEGDAPVGPQRIEAALGLARQLVEALEAAHLRGIVHHDLKPGNVRITPDGILKVLDFGLATLGVDAAIPDTSTLPQTVTLAARNVSTIMGTAAYMSPEQVAGTPSDKRADIWAFGAVLYELLSGKRAFPGATTADVLRAVATTEPDWAALPASTPTSIRRLLERCMAKDPKRRLPDIGVARLEIDDALGSSVPAAVATSRRVRPVWLILAMVVAVAAGAVAVWLRPWATAERPIARFTLQEGAPCCDTNFSAIAISPDGQQVVYGTEQGLFSRLLSDLTPRPVPGSEVGGPWALLPVFSPDGRTIAFYSGGDAYVHGTIKTIAANGGEATTLMSIDYPPYGMTWGSDGILLAKSFGAGSLGLFRLSPSGGPPQMIAPAVDEFLAHPRALPDGRGVLATSATGGEADRWDRARIVVIDGTQRRTVLEGGSDAHYLATGHLVYARRNAIFAVPFDVDRLAVTGKPVPVLEGVLRTGITAGGAQFATSTNGTLVYLSQAPRAMQIGRISRRGVVRTLPFPAGPFQTPRLSPNGTRIAVTLDSGDEADIWIADLKQESLRRLTFGGRNRFPIWSPDGRSVAFQSDREGDRGLFWQLADGTGAVERLTMSPSGTSHEPESWSPGGDQLLFRATTGSRYALWRLALEDRQSTAFGGVESLVPPNAAFSPDGRWVAYMSRDADKFLLYAQPFPPTGAKYQIAEGGILPVWSRDGREIYYFHGSGQFSAVKVQSERPFGVGTPTDLWNAPKAQIAMAGSVPHRGVDPTADGDFVVVTSSSLGQTIRIQVVLNWLSELEARVPLRQP